MLKLLAVTLIVLATTPVIGLGDELSLRDTELKFASLAEAHSVIGTSDNFLKALSRFDLQVRLQTDTEATEDALIELFKREAIEWDEDLRNSVVESIARLRPKLEPFHLPLPKTTLLIQTTGKEESNAAYTRGAAIMLPKGRLQSVKAATLDRLLLHELFHVLSRNAPELRRDLYRIIGFEICNSIVLPSSLAEIKLTNPDAPLVDCYIKLTEGDESFAAAPILYSSSAAYDVETKLPLFKYLTFRLMKIEEHEGQWRPLLIDGEPVMVTPSESKSFAEQIGQNTKYVIHPDEILADNFVHLVLQTEKLPSPQIVEQMGERLKQVRRPE